MDDAPIKKPVTVSYKPECSMCGKINKATNKFCSECGAGLRIK
jgi:rRNA maturation endonuclease Nob1